MAFRLARRLFLLTLSFSLGLSAQSGTYAKLSSKHFNLFVPAAAEQSGQQAISVLEQADAFFSSAYPFPGSLQTGGRLQVIIFNSSAEYQKYALSPNSSAHYLNNNGRQFIAIRDLDTEFRGVLAHEFTHSVIRRSGLKLPTWLNEGLADYYSTLASENGHWLVGEVLSARLGSLRSGTRPRLAALLEANRDTRSPSGLSFDPAFYAESWALTHMLQTSPAYAPRFPEFLRSFAGTSAASTEAIQRVFHRSLEQVEQDLAAYVVTLTQKQCALFAVAQADTTSQKVSPLLLRTVFAELLASQSWSPQAEATLQQLHQEYPTEPRWCELLGSLALRKGWKQGAREYLQAAADLRTENAEALYQLFQLDLQAALPEAELSPLLERVVALNPDNQEALLNLAVLQVNRHQLAAAATTVARIHKIDAQWQSSYDTIRSRLAAASMSERRMSE